MSDELRDLLAQQRAYIDRIKANGAVTALFRTPCCNNELEDRIAPASQRWETVSVCPHCGSIFVKTTAGKVITGNLVL